jgi:hypothetical protein
MKRMFGGLLMVVGGAAMVAGVFPRWAMIGGTEVNGFTLGSDNVDAIITFAAGGLLMLFGLAMGLRRGAPRMLAFIVSFLALMWAALVALLFSGFQHNIDQTVSAATNLFATTGYVTGHIGFYVVAGGAIVGFLGGLMAVGRRRVLVPPAAAATARAMPATPRPAAQAPATRGMAGA